MPNAEHHQKIRSIGEVPWDNQQIREAIPEFLKLYRQRPHADNTGGMKSPHMFATWFMLRQIKPGWVLESGVWKGQGTWLLEQSVPEASLVCIEPVPRHIEWRSEKATYLTEDFTQRRWEEVNKARALLFFDDHQNAFERLKAAYKLGFKHLIFEDNYPASQGDCYSLKKAFMESGFKPKVSGLSGRLRQLVRPEEAIEPNKADAAFLQAVVKTYYEFPPVWKTAKTRWDDDWTDACYPTPEPLYDKALAPQLKVFVEEAQSYTWICYVELA